MRQQLVAPASTTPIDRAPRRAARPILACIGVVESLPTWAPRLIARRLAARFGGESESLYAPALVGDRAVRQALLENDTVRHSLDRARRADIALIGVGDMNADHGEQCHGAAALEQREARDG